MNWRTFSVAVLIRRVRASRVAHAMWGGRKQLRAERRGLSPRGGSCDSTSAPNAAECRQTPAVESIGDSLLVDKRTASGVDQNSRWFHLGYGCGIDEMTCRRREWAVKADHVG